MIKIFKMPNLHVNPQLLYRSSSGPKLIKKPEKLMLIMIKFIFNFKLSIS